uniref:Protein kinase domain-containing protein n=1 Tax=viral metagenome TaxID=1070528 RepID=A0A6C0CER5_9ZZZZ
MLDSIYDRYTIFMKIFNLIKSVLNNDSQCLVPLKKKDLYSINNKIILKKRIGEKSVFGTIFLSSIKPLKYKFITKVQVHDSIGKNELNVLNYVRSYALKTKNFHLPLYIINFNCNSYDIFDKRLPPNITGKYFYSYDSTIAELANGNMNEYIESVFKSGKNISEKIITAIKQCIIAFMTIHHLGIFHNDAHLGNFLFFKVKKNKGYYKYNYNNISFYLNNTGAIFVIWDFGKSRQIESSDNIIKDYSYKFFYSIERIIRKMSFKYNIPIEQKLRNFILLATSDYNMYLNNDTIIKKIFLDENINSGKLLGTVDLF